MAVLEHSLEPPDAAGEPLMMQVLVSVRSLRFLMNLEGHPGGLWRAELVGALKEELAIMEARLRAPVTVRAIPPDVPSPTAVTASVTADDPLMAVQEWNHAVLRAMRNLSMAYGVLMPRLIATREASVPRAS